jgi:hypothetical protein
LFMQLMQAGGAGRTWVIRQRCIRQEGGGNHKENKLTRRLATKQVDYISHLSKKSMRKKET